MRQAPTSLLHVLPSLNSWKGQSSSRLPIWGNWQLQFEIIFSSSPVEKKALFRANRTLSIRLWAMSWRSTVSACDSGWPAKYEVLFDRRSQTTLQLDAEIRKTTRPTYLAIRLLTNIADLTSDVCLLVNPIGSRDRYVSFNVDSFRCNGALGRLVPKNIGVAWLWVFWWGDHEIVLEEISKRNVCRSSLEH